MNYGTISALCLAIGCGIPSAMGQANVRASGGATSNETEAKIRLVVRQHRVSRRPPGFQGPDVSGSFRNRYKNLIVNSVSDTGSIYEFHGSVDPTGRSAGFNAKYTYSGGDVISRTDTEAYSEFWGLDLASASHVASYRSREYDSVYDIWYAENRTDMTSTAVSSDPAVPDELTVDYDEDGTLTPTYGAPYGYTVKIDCQDGAAGSHGTQIKTWWDSTGSTTETIPLFPPYGPGLQLGWHEDWGSMSFSNLYPVTALIADTSSLLPPLPTIGAGMSGTQWIPTPNDLGVFWSVYSPMRDDLTRSTHAGEHLGLSLAVLYLDNSQIVVSETEYWWESNDCLPTDFFWIARFEWLDDPTTYENEALRPAEYTYHYFLAGEKRQSDHFWLSPVSEGRYGRYHVYPGPPAIQLAVDADRNGTIDFGSDATTPANRYRIWQNDDDDSDNTEHPGSARRDGFDDGKIQSERDLEDFFRIHFQVGSSNDLEDKFLDGTLQIAIEWKTADPAVRIRFYKAYESDGGDLYLKDAGIASQQVQNPEYGIALGSISGPHHPRLRLDKSIWMRSGVSSFPRGCLLFEAEGYEGRAELVATIWKGNEKIAENPGIWMDITNVRKMYERSKATPDPWTVGMPHLSTTTPTIPPLGWVSDPNGHQWEYPPVSWSETENYITFVHGWHTSYLAARTDADTVFKRVWQRGYRGRVAAYYWPTLTAETSFNESEWRAWLCGVGLSQYVESLDGTFRKILIAHSLGSQVAGSALGKGMAVESYAMFGATTPASCYDANPALQKSWGANSPDHDTDLATLALGYKLKLSMVDVGNLINFFLSDDVVLTGLWRRNQELFRPQSFTYDHAYGYDASNPPGGKLFLKFPSPFDYRELEIPEESLGYAAKSSTEAAGAEGAAAGSITTPIDMVNYGITGGITSFSDHNAFLVRSLFQVHRVYSRMLNEFGVERNP